MLEFYNRKKGDGEFVFDLKAPRKRRNTRFMLAIASRLHLL